MLIKRIKKIEIIKKESSESEIEFNERLKDVAGMFREIQIVSHEGYILALLTTYSYKFNPKAYQLLLLIKEYITLTR